MEINTQCKAGFGSDLLGKPELYKLLLILHMALALFTILQMWKKADSPVNPYSLKPSHSNITCATRSYFLDILLLEILNLIARIL
jgi:hypothetical protein